MFHSLLNEQFAFNTTLKITPNKPNTDAKISIIKVFTKRDGFSASAIAAPLPVIPTAIL